MAQREMNPTRSVVDSDATIAALLATQTQAKQGGDTGTNEVLLRLLASMSKRLEREEAEEGRKEEELRRLLEARGEGFKQEIARREAIWAACDHRKENGRPCISGQRLSSNDYAFICMHCQKLWDQTTLPAHLTVNMDDIGG